MSEELFQKMSEHLEFLGYTVERAEDGDGLRANHKANFNFRLKKFGAVLLASAGVGVVKEAVEKDRVEYLSIINDINKDSSVIKAYYWGESTLTVESWYPMSYNKVDFAQFVDSWNKDIIKLIATKYYERLKKFLIPDKA